MMLMRPITYFGVTLNPYLTYTFLLISRQKKNELLKAHVKARTPEAKERYCNYRNLHNKVIRASKKLYYRDHIKANKKDPKKLWGLLKEVLTGEASVNKVKKFVTTTKSSQARRKLRISSMSSSHLQGKIFQILSSQLRKQQLTS
jgi:hypothetical protein